MNIINEFDIYLDDSIQDSHSELLGEISSCTAQNILVVGLWPHKINVGVREEVTRPEIDYFNRALKLKLNTWKLQMVKDPETGDWYLFPQSEPGSSYDPY